MILVSPLRVMAKRDGLSSLNVGDLSMSKEDATPEDVAGSNGSVGTGIDDSDILYIALVKTLKLEI